MNFDEVNMDIIQGLMNMGLSEREAKVYRVLLGVNEITASGIPKFTDIPRTKVYEALNSLIKKGFCKEVAGSTGGQTYTAVDPRVALAELMRTEEERIKDLRRLNSNLTDILFDVYSNSTLRLKNYDFVQILRGRQEIVNTYRELRLNAKSEILELCRGYYTMPDEEANQEADENAVLIGRGVQMKVIYETQEIMKEGNKYFHKKNLELGVESRMTPKIPVKMSLFDKKIILLPLSDPLVEEPKFTVLLIEHPQLYILFRQAFDSYWEKSEAYQL